MAGFKTPDFNERSAAARTAKESALDKLRNKPAQDPAVIAERQAARAAKEAAIAEKRAAKQRAEDEIKAAKAAAKAAEEAARLAAEEAIKAEAAAKIRAMPTAAEMKAARDARYAARKARTR